MARRASSGRAGWAAGEMFAWWRDVEGFDNFLTTVAWGWQQTTCNRRSSPRPVLRECLEGAFSKRDLWPRRKCSTIGGRNEGEQSVSLGTWILFFMLTVEQNETPFTDLDDPDRTASDCAADVVWPANRKRRAGHDPAAVSKRDGTASE